MSQNQNPHNKSVNIWRFFRDYLKKNRAFIIASSIGGIIVSSMGLIVNTYEFFTLLKPPLKTESGWILVKITGWAEAEYNYSEQINGIGSYIPFMANKLNGTSNLTPIIYTDYPIDDILGDASDVKDVTVLKNTDFQGKIEGFASAINKRNSQTIQAFLVQALYKKKPVCIFVNGIRNNEKSLFFNIIRAHHISEENIKKYENLSKNIDARKNELKKLTEDTCTKIPKRHLFSQ